MPVLVDWEHVVSVEPSAPEFDACVFQSVAYLAGHALTILSSEERQMGACTMVEPGRGVACLLQTFCSIAGGAIFMEGDKDAAED